MICKTHLVQVNCKPQDFWQLEMYDISLPALFQIKILGTNAVIVCMTELKELIDYVIIFIVFYSKKIRNIVHNKTCL